MGARIKSSNTKKLPVDVWNISVLNPMSLLSGPAEGASLITFSALNILNKRHEFGTMVDTILYNSLDSYYSTRSTYLQTRINEPPEPMEDNLDLFDPYEDF